MTKGKELPDRQTDVAPGSRLRHLPVWPLTMTLRGAMPRRSKRDERQRKPRNNAKVIALRPDLPGEGTDLSELKPDPFAKSRCLGRATGAGGPSHMHRRSSPRN